jgi:hypothetical protein
MRRQRATYTRAPLVRQSLVRIFSSNLVGDKNNAKEVGILGSLFERLSGILTQAFDRS